MLTVGLLLLVILICNPGQKLKGGSEIYKFIRKLIIYNLSEGINFVLKTQSFQLPGGMNFDPVNYVKET